MIDLTNHKFFRLTVVSEAPKIKGKRAWLCKCDCGQSRVILQDSICNGNTKSCGCLMKETSAKSCAITGKKNEIHGMEGTPTYRSWRSMMNRCYNLRTDNYKYYGRRGIYVCLYWHEFKNFFLDMGVRPEGTSLDRINNNSIYEKSNCKWSTYKEQANNRRNNCLIHPTQ